MDRADVPEGDDGTRVRVTLELSRSDDPLLFDALVALKKGRRRVARLRMLAHDGLLAAQVLAAAPDTRTVPVPSADEASGASGASGVSEEGEREALAPLAPEVTGGLFDAPLPA